MTIAIYSIVVDVSTNMFKKIECHKKNLTIENKQNKTFVLTKKEYIKNFANQ
jgi:hypothetical protein